MPQPLKPLLEVGHATGNWNDFRSRLAKNSHLLVPAIFAWLNGWRHRFKFLLLRRRFSAGRYLRIYGPLVLSGPGNVVFGDNCLVISNAIKPVCIRTLGPEAEVRLGNGAGLNGSSIQCARRVDIGDLSNIADAYITDTPAHAIAADRRRPGSPQVTPEPVTIGRNVWISVSVVILQGVTIGDNSVIGACSLVRKDVPADVFAAGNPLKIIQAIPDADT